MIAKGKTVNLGDVADFVRGITFKPDDVVAVGTKDSVVCMRTKNVQTELDCSDIWAVNHKFIKRDDQYLANGDILVSSANSWNLVGKCCWIYDLPWKATFGGFVTVLRPRAKTVEPRFLFHWFSSSRTQTTLRSFGQQTTNISNLNTDRCLKLQLYLPPLSDQRRIAEILDKADELRAKRRVTIAQLDTLAQSIFLEMFGDPTKGRSPFPITTLENVCEKITDGTHNSPPVQQTGIPYITAKHVKDTGLDFFADPWFVSEEHHRSIYSRCDPKLGDVLYIKDGATTGIAAINNYPFKFSMLSSLALLRPRPTKIEAYYLCYWLNNSQVKQEILEQMAGAAIRRLTLTKINAIHVPIPPLDLQRKFTHRIATIERLKKEYQKSDGKLAEFFVSLQSRAFRGEL